MSTFLFCVWVLTTVVLVVVFLLKQRVEKAAATARTQAEFAIKQLVDQNASMKADAEAAAAHAVQALGSKVAELNSYAEQIREHYEQESLRIHLEAQQQIETLLAELGPLREFSDLSKDSGDIRQTIANAIATAVALRREAEQLLNETKEAASEERSAAQRRAREIREQAEAMLTQATKDANGIVTAAEKRAELIAGDAYIALKDKQTLEDAVGSLWNVVEGYGDRYVVPTRSLLDDLAEDYSHTQAGEQLKSAREQSRRQAELNLASTSNYEEEDRRHRANRFVVDAFNGRVDAILSRTKHDNYGTLEREIRDAFNLVNLNGLVFREARVLPSYLDSRLSELKWAVIVQELRAKEREEQRALQEKMREEEKARREYEKAIQEAEKEEALIKRAMEKARSEADHANAEERAKYQAELAQLAERLAEAEAKGQRALSMAQQTRAGHVYIISNIGSFGDDVLKIGMTRRLVPEDRIKELGDASVPFEFDIHAIIRCDDAPSLERMLHLAFEDARINKVNYRKEFFRLPLSRVREFAVEKGLEVTFTMAADARDYRETLALEKMAPQEREEFRMRNRTSASTLANGRSAAYDC